MGEVIAAREFWERSVERAITRFEYNDDIDEFLDSMERLGYNRDVVLLELLGDEADEAEAEEEYQTVREFSPIGPCLTLGKFTRRTKKSIFYNKWTGGTNFEDEESRVGGWKVDTDYIHTEPCPSCRDHENTQYPNGYED